MVETPQKSVIFGHIVGVRGLVSKPDATQGKGAESAR